MRIVSYHQGDLLGEQDVLFEDEKDNKMSRDSKCVAITDCVLYSVTKEHIDSLFFRSQSNLMEKMLKR